MCRSAASEYENISDRRFHAQPIACNACGPKYTLHSGNRKEEDFAAILAAAASFIEQEKLLPLKDWVAFTSCVTPIMTMLSPD